MKITDIMLFGDAINGGGGDSGAKVMVLNGLGNAEDSFSPDGGATNLYRIGGYSPTVEEFNNAIFAYRFADEIVANGSIISGGAYYIYDLVGQFNLTLVDSTDNAGFPYYILVNNNDEVFFAVVGVDVEAENGEVIKAGTYVLEAFVHEHLPTVLIIGVCPTP